MDYHGAPDHHSQHRDLRRISIYVPYHLTFFDVGESVRQIIGGESFGHRSDADRLLIELWESRSILAWVVLMAPEGNTQGARDCIGLLLPEITMRGTVDLFG